MKRKSVRIYSSTGTGSCLALKLAEKLKQEGYVCTGYTVARFAEDKRLQRLNDGWKQEVNMSKRNNQNFVSIPFETFISMLRYKSERQGLRFVEINESHTSKCSSLDLEEIKHHDSYVGKRVKRGLFRTKNGILLNADINGAYNIMRKVKGDAAMPPYRGFGYNPVKKFINK